MLKASAVLLLLVSYYSIANLDQNTMSQNEKSYNSAKKECVLEDLASAGLGDVKYSILSESQFILVNGDEWVLMDNTQNATSLGNIPLNDVNYIFKYLTANSSQSSLPDARGYFFRMKDHNSGRNSDGSNLKLGATQSDIFKSHDHHRNTDGVVELSNVYPLVGNSGISSGYTSGNQTRKYSRTQHTGGTETRSKNMTVNAFIKYKRKCLDQVALAERRSAEARIQNLENYILQNSCDECLTLPETDLVELQAKNACFKTEVDDFEAGSNTWNVSCQARTIGYAKKVLMLIGAGSRTQAETDFLSHMDNQYPYYNVIETK